MAVIKLKIECKSCDGTGLYVGLAERDGAAVICHTCKGSGCQDYNFNYTEFQARKLRKGVTRVFKVAGGYVHTTKDIVGGNGVKIEFSRGGVAYQTWLNGGEPKPLKELYCPLEWTGQMWQSPLFCKDTFFGGFISGCPYRKNNGMSRCWEEYEKSEQI